MCRTVLSLALIVLVVAVIGVLAVASFGKTNAQERGKQRKQLTSSKVTVALAIDDSVVTMCKDLMILWGGIKKAINRAAMT